MAGLFDLHILSAMRHGWRNLIAPIDSETSQRVVSSEKFKSLFDGVADAVMEEWFEALAPDGSTDHLEFRPAYVPEQTKFPCVIVQYEDEPEEEAALGYMGGTVETFSDVYNATTGETINTKFTTDRTAALLLRQTAQVHIMAAHPELVRALHVALIACALNSRSAFYELGYTDLEYIGAADLSIEEGLMPEDLGIFIRVQRYRARSHFEVAETRVAVEGKVFVHADDIIIDGVTGGISSSDDD